MERMININIDDEIKKLPWLDVIIEGVTAILDDNEAFAKSREESFGASDSGSLLGVNKYKSYQDLLNEKAYRIHDPSISEKAAVRKGKSLEDLIIDKASKVLNSDSHKPDNTYRVQGTRLNINFDAVFIDGDGNLIPNEIKFVESFSVKQYNLNRAFSSDDPYHKEYPPIPSQETELVSKACEECGLPPYYYCQIQTQIGALGSSYGVLSVLWEKEWRVYNFYVPRNDEVINAIWHSQAVSWGRVEHLRAHPELDPRVKQPEPEPVPEPVQESFSDMVVETEYDFSVEDRVYNDLNNIITEGTVDIIEDFDRPDFPMPTVDELKEIDNFMEKLI